MSQNGGITAQELVRRACERYAARPLVTDDSETWTYDEAWRRGGQLAAALDARRTRSCAMIPPF
jgi:acyl-CoA synthetase (AMP-forming)/AMP-acid ligase II